MGALTTIRLREPYLLLVGDENDVTYAKTASGIVQWRSDAVAGQLRFTEDAVDLGVPDMSVDEARRGGVGSLVVGVAAAEAARGQVLLAGVAGLVAGAMSMAAGGAEVVRGAGHVVLWGAVAMGLMALVGHAVGTVL